MKAKLFMIVGCLLLLTSCASYDSAFCRSDFCTRTSYIPDSNSDNTDYSCGQRGSSFAGCGYHDTSYTGGGCGTGSGCGGATSCDNNRSSVYSCRESVWDNIGTFHE